MGKIKAAATKPPPYVSALVRDASGFAVLALLLASEIEMLVGVGIGMLWTALLWILFWGAMLPDSVKEGRIKLQEHQWVKLIRATHPSNVWRAYDWGTDLLFALGIVYLGHPITALFVAVCMYSGKGRIYKFMDELRVATRRS